MKNKGFTLIELIATIALLGIIAVISFVSINNVIKESKTRECLSLINSIKTATNEYISDHRYGNLNLENFNASVLVSGNYLSSPIKNPYDKTDIDPITIGIEVNLNSDKTLKAVTISSDDLVCINN